MLSAGVTKLLDEGPFTPIKMQPEEPAMFLYTSGSTGRPKGVVLSHYSHLWAMAQRVRRPGPIGQRSLVAAPLYHMNGLAMSQTTFSQGDTVVLLPQFPSVQGAFRHGNLLSVGGRAGLPDSRDDARGTAYGRGARGGL